MITTIITMSIVGIFSGLVLWMFKLRYYDRKEINSKLVQSQINDEVFNQKLTDLKESRQEKESDFSEILKEIKSSLATLVTEVNDVKVQIAVLISNN
jgi:predicted  nucleic acid-binding Zn-ribbon protein